MSKDLNKVQIIGHLGADPEMRYTEQGSAVTNFRVASGSTWKDRDGNKQERTEWFQVVAWDKLGEICNQYLNKGTRVYIEGRLQTRKWADKEGTESYSTEIVAQDMIILSEKRGGGQYEDKGDDAPAPAPRRNQPRPVADDEVPF